MTCPLSFTTIEDAHGLFQWLSYTLTVFAATTFLCWNYKWYYFLRKHSPMPEMRMLFIVMAVMVTANSWSVWRLWRCEDWDTDFAPLLVYVLLVICLHGFVTALMGIKSLWLCMGISMAACGLAIAYTVLAFIEADTYAGIVGVFDIVYALLLLGYTLYLNPLKEEALLDKYYGKSPKIVPAASLPSPLLSVGFFANTGSGAGFSVSVNPSGARQK
jgi:hypothetical protein